MDTLQFNHQTASATNTLKKDQVLNRKCKQHPYYSLEYLNLKGDRNNMFMCSKCVQSQGISNLDLQRLKEIVSADKTTVLHAFPPVKEQDILFRLSLMDHTKGFEYIDSLFKRFREQIQAALDQDQKKVKIQYIKYSKGHLEAVEEYQKIAEIDKLQQLISSQNEQDQIILEEFLKDKQNKTQENSKALSNLLDSTYQSIGKLQFIEPSKILEEIVEKLHQIDFIEESLPMLSQASLIKSTLLDSPLLETRSDSVSSLLEVMQTALARTWNQIFLEPILDPLKKYVIHIELESKNTQFTNEFFFGIVPDQIKDSKQAFSSNMCYYNSNRQQGITKLIKGSMWTRMASCINRFEVRIYLNSRYLSVGSLPDYSSVVELDDPNKINPQIAYRLFLALLFPLDRIRITKLDTVQQFDNKFA